MPAKLEGGVNQGQPPRCAEEIVRFIRAAAQGALGRYGGHRNRGVDSDDVVSEFLLRWVTGRVWDGPGWQWPPPDEEALQAAVCPGHDGYQSEQSKRIQRRLLGLTSYLARTMLQSRRQLGSASRPLNDGGAAASPDLKGDATWQAELVEDIKEVCRGLSPDERLVTQEKLNGLTLGEIAEKWGLKRSAVEAAWRRARDELRDRLAAYGPATALTE